MKNKLFKKIEMDVIHQIMILLQVTLAIFIITFGIASLFHRELYLICQVFIGLIMFVIAYNNQKIYKRKYMSIIYLGLGIVIVASALFA